MRVPSDGIPRRSQHYAPGYDAKHPEEPKALMQKAAQSDADTIILELEDGIVDENHKEKARANIVEALNGGIDFGDKEVLVRINHFNTKWGRDDLAAIKDLPRLDGIILPKVETLTYVQDVLQTAPDKGLWFIDETCAGERAIPGILDTLKAEGKIDRIKGLIFGNNDYAGQFPGLHADDRNHPLLSSARSSMLKLAQEFNLVAIDGPSRNLIPDLAGEVAYEEDCKDSLRHQFDGKQTINLRQIPIANDIFTPTKASLIEAGHLHHTYGDAQKKHTGAVRHEGEMTERLHDKAALARLKYAQILHHRINRHNEPPNR